MKPKVAAILPSYNEGRSIGDVVQKIDRGLAVLFHPEDCIIVNADSSSEDNTADVFLNTKTKCAKERLDVGRGPHRKGKGIVEALKYCQSNRTEFVFTVDSDVRTATEDWPRAILSPLIQGRCDYTVPCYSRNRYEGSTTNHFAYPLVKAIFGVDVRQPIGGEFGLTMELVDFLLSQTLTPSVLAYGIDIFMTCNAIAGGFTIEESFLGQKIHNPSFHKLEQTFVDVATAGMEIAKHYYGRPTLVKPFHRKRTHTASHDISLFAHQNELPDFVGRMTKSYVQFMDSYDRLLGSHSLELRRQIEIDSTKLSADLWTGALACSMQQVFTPIVDFPRIPEIAHLLLPLFALRTTSFWKEIQSLDSTEAEDRVTYQAEMFRQKMLTTQHATSTPISFP